MGQFWKKLFLDHAKEDTGLLWKQLPNESQKSNVYLCSKERLYITKSFFCTKEGLRSAPNLL